MIGLFRRLSVVAALVLIWEAASRWGPWEPYLFPSPASVLRALVQGFLDKTFLIGTLVSLKRIVIGYSLSLVGGLFLGLLMGTFRTLEETIGVLVVGLQSIPSICWLPLALLWFGLKESAIIFVVVMGAVLSVAIATQAGVKNAPQVYLKAAKSMGAKGHQIYLDVIIPSALPSIITGMKQGWSFAWRSLMAGELLFVGLGLGHLLQVGRELNDINQIVAIMVVIVIIGLFFDQFIFGRLEANVRRKWGLSP